LRKALQTFVTNNLFWTKSKNTTTTTTTAKNNIKTLAGAGN